MNNFYTDNFNISKINMCVYVGKYVGDAIHRNRPYHGLVQLTAGKNEYIFKDGTRVITEAGQVYYLPKFSNYEVREIIPSECIAVNFELVNPDITYPMFILAAEMGNKYSRDFENLLKNWNLRRPGYVNECMMNLYSIICKIQKDKTRSYFHSGTRKTAAKAAEYITKNLARVDLTVQETADILGITPEYLRMIFRNVYGVSPKTYMLNLRMEHAKELILSGEFRIVKVSEMCGYDSESYFSHEFKRICGVSPTAYYRQMLNN